MNQKVNFMLLCVTFNVVIAADYRAHELLMNVLSQFLSTTASEPETTTQSSSILPKILNPLTWIPNFKDIPWNPDSELTTVSHCDLILHYMTQFDIAFFKNSLRLL